MRTILKKLTALTITTACIAGSLFHMPLQSVQAEDFVLVEETVFTQQSDYKIKDVTVQGNHATVKYEAKKDCTILVGLYNDDGTILYTSTKTEVSVGNGIVELKFDTSMPEYFLVKAFVLENKTNVPLGDVYAKEDYTEYELKCGYTEPLAFDEESHGKIMRIGTCGTKVEWKIYEDGMLYISGSGEMDDYSAYGTYTAPWYNYKESVTHVYVEKGITRIGTAAFRECSNIVNVEIASDVKSLAHDAFKDCTSLKQIKLPVNIQQIGERVFVGCTNLEIVTLPKQIKELPERLFYGCSCLDNVRVPEGVEEINDEVFAKCGQLKQIRIPESVQLLGEKIFDNTPWLNSQRQQRQLVIINKMVYDGLGTVGEVIIPQGVTKICYEAFKNCRTIESVVIPDTVTVIERNAFEGCTGLRSVSLSEQIEELLFHTFAGCTNLEQIEFPSGLREIEGNCFDNTKWIEEEKKDDGMVIINDMLYDGEAASGEVVIPDGVTRIMRYAFMENKNLISVKIPDSVKIIESYSFCDCESLEIIVIPDGVTEIGYYAFRDTKWQENNTNEQGLVIINDILCDGKRAQGHVEIESGLTAISERAFWVNKNITSVSIPDSVTSIGEATFYECDKLTKVELKNDESLLSQLFIALNDSYAERKVDCIYAASGSAAEEYAKEHEIAFVSSEENAGRAIIELSEIPPMIIYGAADKTIYEAGLQLENGEMNTEANVSITIPDWMGTVTTADEVYTSEKAAIGRTYLFAVVKDEAAEDLLSSSNLLFINQITADEYGRFCVKYNKEALIDVPKENKNVIFIENKNTGISFGDVDENGTVNLTDANHVLQTALGIKVFDERSRYIGDMNGNKEVTLADANLVLKAALGIF